MSIYSILKSPSFANTVATLSGKAMEMAGGIGKKLPGTVQDLGQKAKGAVDKVPGGAGTVLGVGALAALVGSVLPKKVVNAAALVGAGAIAMNFYQKWSANKNQAAGEGDSVETPALPAADDPAALLMMRAIVYAARADGHIDDTERERIRKLSQQFLQGADGPALVERLMDEPLSLEALASQMQSQEQREDLYRLSCLVIDIDHFMERGYLDNLASALGIDKARQAALEKESEEAKAQLDAL